MWKLGVTGEKIFQVTNETTHNYVIIATLSFINRTVVIYTRAATTTKASKARALPKFWVTVNPISTRGGRLCPPPYWCPQQVLKSTGTPECYPGFMFKTSTCHVQEPS